ncbi:MAG: heme-binding protein [Actinomycetota bacterium]|nr:heme-binding protein [Actinomycetota bacterium]
MPAEDRPTGDADVTLAEASTIIDATLARGVQLRLAALTVAVLDSGGHLVALKRSDRSGILRADVAIAKAWAVLAMGWPSHELVERAQRMPQFFASLGVLAGGRMLPVAGGVPIRRRSDVLVGAVGVSGDTSDNDEACAVHGVEAAGLVAWLDRAPPG